MNYDDLPAHDCHNRSQSGTFPSSRIVQYSTMGVWETISCAIETFSGRLNTRATDRTFKAEDLLAFRTIITMLSYLQSHNGAVTSRSGPSATNKTDHNTLRVLDALSTIMTRQHEVIAVLAKPYDGSTLQVFASVVYSNKAEPLLQPSAEPDQDLWSRVCKFVAAIDTRETKVNNQNDSLMNKTSVPFIGDHQDKVPQELVTRVKENAPVLDIFLQKHW